jgi:hypothetical protein
LSGIMNLSARQDEPKWQALAVAEHMDFGAQSTSGTPQSLVFFFFEPAAC